MEIHNKIFIKLKKNGVETQRTNFKWKEKRRRLHSYEKVILEKKKYTASNSRQHMQTRLRSKSPSRKEDTYLHPYVPADRFSM